MFAVFRPTLQNWGKHIFFYCSCDKKKIPFCICGKSGFVLFRFDSYFIVTGTCSRFSEVPVNSVQLSGKSIEMIRINRRLHLHGSNLIIDIWYFYLLTSSSFIFIIYVYKELLFSVLSSVLLKCPTYWFSSSFIKKFFTVKTSMTVSLHILNTLVYKTPKM